MEIKDSARKHGLADADILHAWNYQLRYVLQDYNGDLQMLVFGPSCDGALLELVVPCDDPQRIIHADYMRDKFLRYLQ